MSKTLPDPPSVAEAAVISTAEVAFFLALTFVSPLFLKIILITVYVESLVFDKISHFLVVCKQCLCLGNLRNYKST